MFWDLHSSSSPFVSDEIEVRHLKTLTKEDIIKFYKVDLSLKCYVFLQLRHSCIDQLDVLYSLLNICVCFFACPTFGLNCSDVQYIHGGAKKRIHYNITCSFFKPWQIFL